MGAGAGNQDITATTGDLTINAIGTLTLEDGSGPARRTRLVTTTGDIFLNVMDLVIQNNDSAVQILSAGDLTIDPGAGKTIGLGDDAVTATSDFELDDSELNSLDTSGTGVLTIGDAADSGRILLDMAVAFTTFGGDLTLNTDSTLDDNSTTTAFSSSGTLTMTTDGAIGGAGSSGADGLETDVAVVVVTDTSDTTGNNVTITDSGANGDTTFDIATGGTGTITVVQSTNNLVVDTIATTGNVDLTATAGSIIDDTSDAVTDVSGNVVTLTAGTGVGETAGNGSLDTAATTLDVSVTGTGLINIAETNAVDLQNIDTANGGITITTGGATTVTDVVAGTAGSDVSITASTGDITVTTVTAAGGAAGSDVTLTAQNGAIVDDASNATVITGGLVTLTATGAIGATGASNEVDTTAVSLNVSAGSGGGAGAIFLGESNGVDLLDVDTANGTITITTGGNTTITDVQSGTNGVVSVTASTGDIEVDTFSSGTGAGLIVATAGAITDADDNSTVTAGALTLTAQDGIGAGAGLAINTTVASLNGSVTGAGNLFVDELNAIDLLDVDTANGSITVTTGGNTTITDVQSGTNGAVSVTASTGSIEVDTFSSGTGAGTIVATAGAITDADGNSTVTAGALTLTASTGIGALGNEINTTAVSLDGSVTAAGNLFVNETNAIDLLDVDTANGLITVTAGGLLTATDVVSSTDADANDIDLTGVGIAVGVVNAGTVNGDVFLDAGTGAITDANAATNNVTAQDLTADATTGIDLDTTVVSVDASVSGVGTIAIDELNAVTLADVDTANGSITITAGGLLTATDVVSTTDADANDIDLTGVGIAVGVVNAGTVNGDVFLDAGTGAITDANAATNNVTAQVLTADAQAGINLDTTATSFDIDNTIAGAIDIDNSSAGAATITSLNNTAAGGAITFDQTGGGDLDVSAGVASNNGAITLTSADEIALGSATISAGTSSIALEVDSANAIAATLDLASSVLNATGGIDLIGNGTDDTLISQNLASTFVIDGINSGTLDNTGIAGVADFNGFVDLTGRAASDTFNFTTGSITGTADGAGGANTLSFAGSVAVTVTLTSTDTVGFQGTIDNTAPVVARGDFRNITVLTGSGNIDTLVGRDVASAWNIDGTNQYVAGNTLNFAAMENLTGGSAVDTFTFDANHTGDVNGGTADDVFDFNGTAVLTGAVDGGLGTASSNDLLDFSDSTLTLTTNLGLGGSSHGFDGTVTGTPNLISGGFDNIDFLLGNGGILIGPNRDTWWKVTSTDTGTFGISLAEIGDVTFNSFSIHAGNQNDTFVFQVGGEITNGIDGGGGVNVLAGSSGADTFTITNAVTILQSTPVNGTSVRVNVGGNLTDLTNIDIIDGADASDIGADTFNFNVGVNWAGTLDGAGGTQDVLNVGNRSPVTVTLTDAIDDVGFSGTVVSGATTVIGGGFEGMDSIIGGNLTDVLVTQVPGGAFTIQSGFDEYQVNPTLTFNKFEVITGSTGVDVFNVNESFAGTLNGNAGNDIFNFNSGTFSGALNAGAGNNIYTFEGGAVTAAVTIAGNDTWNYAPGKSLGGGALAGAESTSLIVLAGPLAIADGGGTNITVSDGDLNLPVLTNFNGNLIIGGTLTPPTQSPNAGSTVTFVADLLTVATDIETNGDITLLASNVTLDGANLRAGRAGALGDDVLIIASGTQTGPGDITAILHADGAPVLIEAGSLTMIAANTVVDATSIEVDLGGTGLMQVATGSGDSLEFGVVNAVTGTLTPEMQSFIEALQLGTGGAGIELSSSLVLQANLAGNLIGLEQLAFIDVGLFEQDLSLFGVIGQGVALALAQCEEVEGCAPNVTEAELADLIEKLNARIAELERRLTDPKSEKERQQIEKLLVGYRAELENFNGYKSQLEQYAKAAAEEEAEFEEDLTGEEFGGPADVAGQVKRLSVILEFAKRRADWLEGLKADAETRDRLGKSTGIDLTIEALDAIIEATRKEGRFIEQQIQQLLGGTQASLEPFRAESGDYSTIRSIGFGPALLRLDSSSVAARDNWY
ncbi:MAG: hypothetical protein HYY48_03600 [Gammaproteobacteria bacterium]|nr:hypothetical protein [Gammaproteobacteria bacterium]